ncbi:ABC transporter substrate-binding protein [Actinorhabdospora filicis]|uniref:ABC transporter substrate-binding protein n=1 Tax=Actinorhabdospora filicis TaxID=1785913 RepID=A0A9W6WDI8_9ACTN|nr:ABC transporter substrate-binding protein [Actinorhabdospora filicis]GLZ81651.1 ABC transporter substrate-binding protein [Actinorhabdospora filicis]
MRTRVIPLAAAALLALAACGGPTGADGPGPSAPAVADRVEPLDGVPVPALPVTVASADGVNVTLTDVDRIVPLSGSLSEIVFTLGLGERVVARDITATFAQAAALPLVTRGHDVSAEGVLSLRPSVVLAEEGNGPVEAMTQIRQAGIHVVVVKGAADLSDVDTRIAGVAAALGVPEAGQRLRQRTAERLDGAKATIPAGAAKPRVAFLYLRGSASVYLIGAARSGAAGLIEAAGGIDAGKEAGLDGDFVPITAEAMAAAAPDVILVMTKGLASVDGVDGLLALPGVAQTPAGMDRRVAAIDDGVLLNYGPRTDQVLTSLITQIHAA